MVLHPARAHSRSHQDLAPAEQDEDNDPVLSHRSGNLTPITERSNSVITSNTRDFGARASMNLGGGTLGGGVSESPELRREGTGEYFTPKHTPDPSSSSGPFASGSMPGPSNGRHSPTGGSILSNSYSIPVSDMMRPSSTIDEVSSSSGRGSPRPPTLTTSISGTSTGSPRLAYAYSPTVTSGASLPPLSPSSPRMQSSPRLGGDRTPTSGNGSVRGLEVRNKIPPVPSSPPPSPHGPPATSSPPHNQSHPPPPGPGPRSFSPSVPSVRSAASPPIPSHVLGSLGYPQTASPLSEHAPSAAQTPPISRTPPVSQTPPAAQPPPPLRQQSQSYFPHVPPKEDEQHLQGMYSPAIQQFANQPPQGPNLMNSLDPNREVSGLQRRPSGARPNPTAGHGSNSFSSPPSSSSLLLATGAHPQGPQQNAFTPTQSQFSNPADWSGHAPPPPVQPLFSYQHANSPYGPNNPYSSNNSSESSHDEELESLGMETHESEADLDRLPPRLVREHSLGNLAATSSTSLQTSVPVPPMPQQYQQQHQPQYQPQQQQQAQQAPSEQEDLDGLLALNYLAVSEEPPPPLPPMPAQLQQPQQEFKSSSFAPNKRQAEREKKAQEAKNARSRPGRAPRGTKKAGAWDSSDEEEEEDEEDSDEEVDEEQGMKELEELKRQQQEAQQKPSHLRPPRSLPAIPGG
ncbi:hypothetical protein DL96DRAFT_322883 [Flagelloscypha sp. PMI_526]|nr:hypothetical protein DL96DRAFT_322883 [Flagelloscypha sp. PMI_526]